MKIKTGIGQDSHRFEETQTDKKCVIGGIVFYNVPALAGNSDADVILHAICNAISGVTGVNILGKVTDKMCQQRICKKSTGISWRFSNLEFVYFT